MNVKLKFWLYIFSKGFFIFFPGVIFQNQFNKFETGIKILRIGIRTFIAFVEKFVSSISLLSKNLLFQNLPILVPVPYISPRLNYKKVVNLTPSNARKYKG